MYINHCFGEKGGLFAYCSYHPEQGIAFYQCTDIHAGYLQFLYSTNMFLYNMCTSKHMAGGLSKYLKTRALFAFDNVCEDYYSWSTFHMSCEDRLTDVIDKLIDHQDLMASQNDGPCLILDI